MSYVVCTNALKREKKLSNGNKKQYTIYDGDNKVTITVGDYVRVKTKDENAIGKIVDLSNSYLVLQISEHNRNINKTFLYIDLLEIEQYED